jgi:hypothetical protein
MKTYPTIKEAFKNGTGDVFFQHIHGGYICISRHDEENLWLNFDSPSLRFLEHCEIMELTKDERQPTPPPPPPPTPEPAKKYKRSSGWYDSEFWYMQYSDADPGL